MYVHPSEQLGVLSESGIFYAPVTREMLAIPGLSLSHVRVWAELYLQTMNRPGWWRSYGNLAKDVGMARVTVMRATTWLADRGLLTVERRKDEAGDDAPNIFRVHFPSAGGGVGNETTPSRPHDTTPGRSGDTAGGHTRETRRKIERSKTKERNTSSPPGREFDEDDDEEIVRLVEEAAWKRGFELRLEFEHNAREAVVAMVCRGESIAFASNTAIKATSAWPVERAAGTPHPRSPRPGAVDAAW